MMGPAQRADEKLFYVGISIDQRVPSDHPLRQVAAAIDFDFVRGEVADLYGIRGNPSVDPAVLLKLMFLLYYENVRSERQLMRELPMRLDWMWFCGYDFDDTLPDHSVISKARRRWGPEAFEGFFEGVLASCIRMGLVDGAVLHADASVVRAHADPSKMQPALREVSRTLYARLEAEAGPKDPHTKPPEAPPTMENATDPDARMTCVHGKTVLGYKAHRLVDDRHQIITATVTTHAATPEGEVLETLLNEHERQTCKAVETVVADKAYGTAENYHDLHARHATPCIPHRQASAPGGRFGPKAFTYDRERDCMICPAGERLRRIGEDASERRTRYQAPAHVCAACPLRAKCTEAKHGRRVGRLWHQDEVDWADGCLSRAERRRLMTRRQTCAEGSFADAANNHGFKRARWRGLMRMRIQDLLIAAAQNVRKFLKAVRRRATSAMAARVCRGISSMRFLLAHRAVSSGKYRSIFHGLRPRRNAQSMRPWVNRSIILISPAPVL
jgi:transposase